MNTLENILSEVDSIRKNAEEISRLKGENFNIFSVLRRERDEVVVHNRFIAELLNTKGSHGLGNTPLNYFLEHLQALPRYENLSKEKRNLLNIVESEQFQVKAEHYLGAINEDQTKGGYVDVALLSQQGNIFIESKIDAEEQNQQLLRYHNDSQNTPNVICYLTLDGKKGYSAKGLKVDEDYIRLSYETDIIQWLTKVNKHAYDFPVLRETITQYIHLLKKLTGQLYTQQMQDNLIQLIGKNAENYKAAKLIHDNFHKVDKLAFIDFFEKLENSVGQKFDRSKDNRDDSGFATLFSVKMDKKEYSIGVQIELRNQYLFICAIEKKQKRAQVNKNQEFNELANKLIESFPDESNLRRLAYCLVGTFDFSFHLENYLLGSDEEKQGKVNELAATFNDITNKVQHLNPELMTKVS
jgi:hypothetical protein